MFKIHFRRNKETIISVVITVAVFVLLLVDGLVLVPKLFEVYSPSTPTVETQLIDRDSVNKAIDELSQ